MPKERNASVETNKPAVPADKRAASESTQDGLQKTRENSASREEVSQAKTPQGQSNRG